MAPPTTGIDDPTAAAPPLADRASGTGAPSVVNAAAVRDLWSYDQSRVQLTIRPGVLAALLVAVLSGLVWLGTKSPPQLLLAVAILIAVVIDGVLTRRALRDPVLEVQNPADAIAGQPTSYVLRVRGVPGPVEVLPPPPLASFAATVVDPEPISLLLPAPPRGVQRYLVVDLRASGPLGLFQASRRTRTTFTTPVFIGPAPLPHELDWPYPRTMRMGLAPTSSHGHDLFRGVREYVRGDSRRDVHWRSTAHQRRLMVKEHDGTGVIALRIVVQLDSFGSASDAACARAAWLAGEGLSRGWMVHLVTVEPIGTPAPPPLLQRATDRLAIFSIPPVSSHTIDLPVETPSQVRRRLAAAVPGRPELGTWRGLTRQVGSGGDAWA